MAEPTVFFGTSKEPLPISPAEHELVALQNAAEELMRSIKIAERSRDWQLKEAQRHRDVATKRNVWLRQKLQELQENAEMQSKLEAKIKGQ
jgi:hypothetical protein